MPDSDFGKPAWGHAKRARDAQSGQTEGEARRVLDAETGRPIPLPEQETPWWHRIAMLVAGRLVYWLAEKHGRRQIAKWVSYVGGLAGVSTQSIEGTVTFVVAVLVLLLETAASRVSLKLMQRP